MMPATQIHEILNEYIGGKKIKCELNGWEIRIRYAISFCRFKEFVINGKLPMLGSQVNDYLYKVFGQYCNYNGRISKKYKKLYKEHKIYEKQY